MSGIYLTNNNLQAHYLKYTTLYFYLQKSCKEKQRFVPHRVAKLEISNKFQQGKWTLTNQHNAVEILKLQHKFSHGRVL